MLKFLKFTADEWMISKAFQEDYSHISMFKAQEMSKEDRAEYLIERMKSHMKADPEFDLDF